MKKKKPGLQMKFDKEKLILIIVVALVFVFIFSMPYIYKFFMSWRNGDLFRKDEPKQEEKPTPKPNEPEKPIEEPSGKSSYTCSLTTSTTGGDLVESYVFYYSQDSLTNLKMVRKYDAGTDDYLNYIYSEQAQDKKKQSLYSSVDGYSFNSKLSNSTYTATTILDLSKVTSETFKNEDEKLTIPLDVTYQQNIDEIVDFYTTKGYTCK